MENNCYVYTLSHAEDFNKVFYVGRGTIHYGQFDRYAEHLRKAKAGSELYVHRKIRKIQSLGHIVIFDIVKTGLTFEESQELEVKLIASYGLDNLTNITPGGDDHPLKNATPEQRAEFIQRIKDGMRNERKQVFLSKEGSDEVWTFESGVKAAEFLRVSPQAVCNAATGKTKSCKGYKVTFQ